MRVEFKPWYDDWQEADTLEETVFQGLSGMMHDSGKLEELERTVTNIRRAFAQLVVTLVETKALPLKRVIDFVPNCENIRQVHEK